MFCDRLIQKNGNIRISSHYRSRSQMKKPRLRHSGSSQKSGVIQSSSIVSRGLVPAMAWLQRALTSFLTRPSLRLEKEPTEVLFPQQLFRSSSAVWGPQQPVTAESIWSLILLKKSTPRILWKTTIVTCNSSLSRMPSRKAIS